MRVIQPLVDSAVDPSFAPPDPVASMWAEIDSTDWRRHYRGVILAVARERGVSRQYVRVKLFRDRDLDCALAVLKRKREIQRPVWMVLEHKDKPGSKPSAERPNAERPNAEQTLRRLRRYFDVENNSALAPVLGVSRAAVSYWKVHNRVPWDKIGKMMPYDDLVKVMCGLDEGRESRQSGEQALSTEEFDAALHSSLLQLLRQANLPQLEPLIETLNVSASFEVTVAVAASARKLMSKSEANSCE